MPHPASETHASFHAYIMERYRAHVAYCAQTTGRTAVRQVLMEFSDQLVPVSFEAADSIMINWLQPPNGQDETYAATDFFLSSGGSRYVIEADKPRLKRLTAAARVAQDCSDPEDVCDGAYIVLSCPEADPFLVNSCLWPDARFSKDEIARFLLETGLTRALSEAELHALLRAVQASQPDVEQYVLGFTDHA
jgi:hypothetical protein